MLINAVRTLDHSYVTTGILIIQGLGIIMMIFFD